MPFFIPLVAAAGGFVVRRWVWVAGVGLVAMYYDEAGELIGNAIGDEANKVMEDARRPPNDKTEIDLSKDRIY